MTPRQARRRAAGRTAVVTVDEDGLVLLLPFAVLRRTLRALRKVVPRKLHGGIRFRVREGAVRLEAISANRHIVAEFPIPAVVSDEALQRFVPFVLEAWRLERVCAVPDIGDWLSLAHDPVSRQRKWAASLWPLVLKRLRGGDTFVVAVGVAEPVPEGHRGPGNISTRIWSVDSEALAEAAFHGAIVADPGAYCGLATATAGVASLEALQEDGGVRMVGPVGADGPRRAWWWAET